VKASTPTRSWFTTLRVRRPLELFQFGLKSHNGGLSL
jgi:hypothetical protein